MAEHKGWSYLDSDDIEEFSGRIREDGFTCRNADGEESFHGDDGSWGYTNADGSGSFYGSDGSWGYRNADGSGSFYGEDGSWGYREADGSGSFYSEDGSWGYWDPEGNKTIYGDLSDDSRDEDDEYDSDSEDFGIGDAVAAVIGIGVITAAAANKKKEGEEKERRRIREKEETRRREKAKKRKEWQDSPAGRKMRKVGFTAIAVLVVVISLALLASSIKVVGSSSDDLIGTDHSVASSQLRMAGFWDVGQTEISDLAPSQADQDGLVTNVKIGFFENFSAGLMVPCFISPEITYHTLASINAPLSSESIKGMDYREAASLFENAGYLDIVSESKKDVIFGLISKENEVVEVRIGETTSFTENEKLKPDITVTIVYHSKIFN